MCGFGQLAESAVAGTNAGEGQNGNVIILPKRYRFRGRLLGAGLVGKENGEPVEAKSSPETLHASSRPSM